MRNIVLRQADENLCDKVFTYSKLKSIDLNGIWATEFQELFESDIFCQYKNLNVIKAGYFFSDYLETEKSNHKSSAIYSSLVSLKLNRISKKFENRLIRNERFPFLFNID